MKLNDSADYALRIMQHLAKKGGTCQSGDMARDLSISRAYLVQVMQPLRKSLLVESVAGRNGGYRLATRPEWVTVADIADAIGGFEFRPGPASGVVCEAVNGLLRDATLASLLSGTCGLTCSNESRYGDSDCLTCSHCGESHEIKRYDYDSDEFCTLDDAISAQCAYACDCDVSYCPNCGAKVVASDE